VLLLVSCSVPGAFAACPSGGNPTTTTTTPSEINVAVLVWANTDEVILSRPLSSYPAINSSLPAWSGSGRVFQQPFYLGVELYERLLANYSYQLPLLGGRTSVKMNISYVNMGSVDWSKLDPSSGYPLDGFATIARANAPGGLFDTLAYNSSALLGGNKTFTFFVAHPLLLTFVYPFLNRIEDERLGIVVHPLLTPESAFVCDGITDPLLSTTPDCTSSKYGRNRLAGARRFETLFSVMSDLSNDATTTLDLYHTIGVKTIALFYDASSATATYSLLAAQTAILYSEGLGLNILVNKQLVRTTSAACAINQNCSPTASTTMQVWPNGTTGLFWAAQLRDLNIDAVMIIGGTGSTGTWAFGQLFRGMQEMDWTPKILSWIGAFEKTTMSSYLPNGKLDMLYTTGEIVWDSHLRGSLFQPLTTSTNFELIQSNSSSSAPTIFVEKLNALYGPTCAAESCVAPAAPGTAHPFWNGEVDGGTTPAIGYYAMVMVQKLIEASASSDVPTILNAASRINTPSVFQKLRFDTQGRTDTFPVVVTQYVSIVTNNETVVLSPFNIGAPIIFPMPTWSERVFNPRWYATSVERLVVAFTTICILAVVCVCAGVLKFRNAAVIRATTVSFSVLISAGGVMMLASNFFNTLHTNDAHCAAQVWFLTCGFTLMFAALFVKTFRIWYIFKTSKLVKPHITSYNMVMAVMLLLLVDVIFNCIWQVGGGMTAKLHTPDSFRPSLNYYACDFSSPVAGAMIYAHLALKGGMLVGGVLLTLAVRGVPGDFNDTMILSICIYNVTVVAAFLVPIEATDIGGRGATYAIRAFGIMFVVIGTVAVLYLPKFWYVYIDDRVERTDKTCIASSHQTTMTPAAEFEAVKKQSNPTRINITKNNNTPPPGTAPRNPMLVRISSPSVGEQNVSPSKSVLPSKQYLIAEPLTLHTPSDAELNV